MNDDRLRDLLDDAVADVEPRRGLDEIRSRTAPSRHRRPWVWGAGGAVLAAAAAAAVVATISAGPGTTGAGPDTAAAPTASAEPTSEAVTVPVYYLGDTSHGPRLYREFDRDVPPAGADPATLAVSRAVGSRATDPDYFSPWPQTGVDSVRHADGLVVVRLVSRGGSPQDRPAGMSPRTAGLAVQQVVYTAQAALQTRDPVRLLLDGSPADTVLGVPTSEPLTNAPADDVLAQVQVTSPAQGATVRSPFTVAGLAAAFEANVQWELKQGDTVVRRGFGTAQECCVLSPYSFRVSAPPGDYTLVVHDEDASGGEGLPPWQDTKDVTVTAD
jgi:Immunoglobulin-like domain of bacterial spore germination/Sporulation and spore germination